MALHTNTPNPLVGFDVQPFKTRLQENRILKPTKWMFSTTIPSGLVGGSDSVFINAATRDLQFWAQAAVIPGVTMVSHDIMRYGYGPAVKHPYSPGFSPVQITFIADGIGANWTFFKQWMNLIINFDMEKGIDGWSRDSRQVVYEVGYPDDYTVNCEVSAFVDSGEQILQVNLREAFPIVLSDMRMDWADTGGPATFNVMMMYTDWFQSNLNIQKNIGENITAQWTGNNE